jgi:HEAT repeat protein
MRSWLLPLVVALPLAWLGSTAEPCIRFKKPGGSVPPNLREPSDPAPAPTPTEPSDPPPAPGDTPPTTPPGGAPAPTTPSAPPPSAPPPTTGEGPQRGKTTVDDTTWETWWELNRIEFFPRRWVSPVVTDDTGRRPSGPQHLSPDVVQSKLWPVLQKLVTDKQVFVQEAALITMGRVAATEAQRAEARETLFKAVSNKNHLIARAAALGLFYVADETSVRPMYTVASNEKTPEDVRAFLALTLTALKSPLAGELLKGLATHKDTPFELAAAAYMALGYNGTDNDPTVPEFLKDTYKNTKLRTEFRAEAVESFGRLGDFAQAHETLVHALKADKDEDVRRSAAIALGVLDYRTDAERKIASIKAPYEAYIGVPMSPADEGQIKALETVIPEQRKKMDNDVREVVRALTEAMNRDSDGFVKRMATISLGRIAAQTPSPDAIRNLETMYKKAQQGAREFNLLALAIAKAPQTYDLAVEALTGKNQPPSTRSAGCIAFGILGDVRANDMLKKTAENDPHPYIRGYGALALGMVGGPGAGPTIQQMVKTSRSPVSRAYGMLGLALLGTNQGTDDIVAVLKTDEVRDGFVASHMVYALGLTKDRRPSTFDALVAKAQDDSDMYVQAATIAAIGYLSTGEFYPQRHLMARGFNYLMTLDLIQNYFYKL